MPLPNTAAAAGFQNPEAYGTVEPTPRALADQIRWSCGRRPCSRCRLWNRKLNARSAPDWQYRVLYRRRLTEAYVEFARSRNTNPHINFRAADARALPFEDNSFDRAFSMLVLQFIPDAARAVAEMRRVVRSGGTVTAAVWDAYGGMPHMRMVWDIAAVLDPSIEGYFFRPLSQPNEMANLWRELGFVDVEQTSLLIRMEFSGFDDYWLPLTSEGPLAKFAAGLSATARASLTEQVRRAYVANLSDGPRSFASVAWACRGTVPA